MNFCKNQIMRIQSKDLDKSINNAPIILLSFNDFFVSPKKF